MTTDVLEERRSLRHTPECATGARAETRGACNCGAHERPAVWSIQVLREVDDNGRNKIRIHVPDALTWVETCSLGLALHDVQLRTSALWDQRNQRMNKPTKRKD